jgi:molybdopterin molybdotransferase
MVDVKTAEKIVLANSKEYGTEIVPLAVCLNRILAQDIISDRDMPPFNRSTMDGIGIRYKAVEGGLDKFKIAGTQAAGEDAIVIRALDECVEIMTGAALDESADTIIPYEHIEIKESIAHLKGNPVKLWQFVHKSGADKKKGELICKAGAVIDATIIHLAASVGLTRIEVKKLPKVIIISTGNELVEPDALPGRYEVRRSNHLAIYALLEEWRINAAMVHVADDFEKIKEILQCSLEQFDVIIISGGISMGKFDYLPKVLTELNVEEQFYKVKQRPGKPFWFGTYKNKHLIFALPGNPVSTFMCTLRYIKPWLLKSLGLAEIKYFARVNEALTNESNLCLFRQVKLRPDEQGQMNAEVWNENGSGDFSKLIHCDAFMEMPAENTVIEKGSICRIWPYKKYFL